MHFVEIPTNYFVVSFIHAKYSMVGAEASSGKLNSEAILDKIIGLGYI